MRWARTAVWWTTIAAFALGGPLVGVVAGRLAGRLELERAWARCSGYAAEQADDLLEETRVLVGELGHLKSFFEAQPDVTREQFRLYTKEVLESHPAIQAIEWAPRVPADRRDAHERQAEAAGLRSYRVRSLAQGGGLVIAPSKPGYYPVFYVEPSGPNVSALGFDLSTERTRNAALTLAIQTRQAALSDPVEIVQGPRGSRSILAMMAVYRGGAGTVPGRRHEPDGAILLVIRIEELLEHLLERHGVLDVVPMRFDLVDENAAGGATVLGSVSSADGRLPLAGRAFEESLAVGGQRWRLIGRPTEAFLQQQLTRWPLALGTGVFLFWEAAGGLALLLLTRRKDAALRSQARLYEAAVRSLSEGVVVVDDRGRFVLFNPAAESILGIGQEEIGPKEWSATYGCFYPDTHTPFPPEQLPLARALRGEEAEQELFIRNRGVPEGVWIVVSGAPLRNEQGNLEGGVVVFRDITAWKKSTHELLRLSSAVEQTADTVFITNRDGVIEYVNPAFEATTGYSRGEAVGQTPRILKSGQTSSQQYAQLWDTILAGETYRTHVVNRKKSGEFYHAEQTITPVKAPDGSVAYFVAVVKDMTDRFRRQAQEIEMRYASQIQKKLYPAGAPQVEGYDVAGAVLPAEATCGDYFDYLPMDGGGLGLVIGDVCGHGLGPALIMAATRSYLRFLSKSRPNPALVFEIINDVLYADLESNNYVAMILIRLDATARRFSYANAGHLAGYHLDPLGGVKTVLDSTGRPLGLFPGQTYECRENLLLEAGELVVLFTDGVPEAEDASGRTFGVENALSVIRAHYHESAERIVQSLCDAVRDFVGPVPQQDDITVVVCKVGP
jgi:PAS domain S-box-containing protein